MGGTPEQSLAGWRNVPRTRLPRLKLMQAVFPAARLIFAEGVITIWHTALGSIDRQEGTMLRDHFRLSPPRIRIALTARIRRARGLRKLLRSQKNQEIPWAPRIASIPPSMRTRREMAKAMAPSGFELVVSRADRAVIEADCGEAE